MRRVTFYMIRTWVTFYGLSPNRYSLSFLSPGRGAFLLLPAFSPTRPAWRILPERYSPRRKDARPGGLLHAILIASFITVWDKCRSFGKSVFGSLGKN